MPLHVSWGDFALRLTFTVMAGLAIGHNREEQGKSAGVRTTLLVCLAACVAMLQVNLLMPLAGRSGDSFVMNDLMRLPLGVLTGVGFIGAGTILRRNDLVTGVTTAATLWLVTVIGLCFGGGQYVLGWTATGLGLAALRALGLVERRIPRERIVRLTVECDSSGPDQTDLMSRLDAGKLKVTACEALILVKDRVEFVFELRHVVAAAASPAIPGVVDELAQQPGVRRVEWRGPGA
jgi:putative Mg2+ transporter-C (MgtC) family protein